MTEEYAVLIEADGTIAYVYSDTLDAVFADLPRTTTRASHVEPAETFAVPGGGWLADMRPSGGPLLGAGDEARDGLHGFATRQAALDAERAWLAAHRGV